MQQFEKDYAALVDSILYAGEERMTRNGITKSMFARTLVINMLDGAFPLIQGRQMFYKGVLGEFAAMMRQPKHLRDFERWGCNYWKLWAKEDGSIDVDYGNAWFADGQMERLIDKLKNDPYDRRMLINGWRAERLGDLDLPCCHYSYQFYVSHGKYLDMVWNQRSVDMMIGLPADIILAATWMIVLANEVGLEPGVITMQLGDCHIYEEHFEQAKEYLANAAKNQYMKPTYFKLLASKGTPMVEMRPDWFDFKYTYLKPITFKLKE